MTEHALSDPHSDRYSMRGSTASMPHASTAGASPAPSLEALPQLVLDNICEHLAGSRQELSSLASTSRRLAAASESHRFRSVVIEPRGHDDLASIVDGLRVLLATRLKYVRELIFDTNYTGQAEYGRPPLAARDNMWTWPFHHSVRKKHACNLGVMRPSDGLTPEETRAFLERQWEPLVCLVKDMPGLVKLRWASSARLIPPSLLRALEYRQPPVRLHVETFDLNGLYQPSRQDQERQMLSPDEEALIASPTLDAIRLRTFSGRDPRGYWDYHADAVMDIVKMGALRHVAMSRIAPSGELPASNLGPGIPRCWTGPRLSAAHPSRTISTRPQDGSQFESLVLLWGSGDDLPKWIQGINLSNLTRLEVDGVRLSTLKLLETNSHYLNSLCSLNIRLDFYQPYEPEIEGLEEAQRALARLLRVLPPLRHIQLSDFEAPVLLDEDDILHRHGPSLRSLYLGSVWWFGALKLQQVERVVKICRRLQRLEVVVPRSQSDAAELAFYRVLGRLPLLETVTLKLACWPPVSLIEDSNYIGKGCTRAEYRAALENVAIDEKLVKAIFGVLAACQAEETGMSHDSLPLYRVRVIASAALPIDHLVDMDIHDIFTIFERSWVCARRTSGMELQEEDKEPRHKKLVEAYGNGLEWLEDPEFTGAWTDTWGDAGVKGSICWTDAWWATPLSV